MNTQIPIYILLFGLDHDGLYNGGN